jgi:hypothetical protein
MYRESAMPKIARIELTYTCFLLIFVSREKRDSSLWSAFCVRWGLQIGSILSRLPAVALAKAGVKAVKIEFFCRFDRTRQLVL